MATRDVYLDDVLRESWNDDTEQVTFYDETGALVETRAYSPEEAAAAEALATAELEQENQSTIETNLAADLDAMQAIINQTNAELRTDPSQELKDIAKAVRRLTRTALGDYTGTE